MLNCGIPMILIIFKIIFLTKGATTVAAVILKFSSLIFLGKQVSGEATSFRPLGVPPMSVPGPASLSGVV